MYTCSSHAGYTCTHVLHICRHSYDMVFNLGYFHLSLYSTIITYYLYLNGRDILHILNRNKKFYIQSEE